MVRKIVVLLGGISPEREVSLVSGAEIVKQLQLNGHQVITIDPVDFKYGYEMIEAIHKIEPDLVFIGLHGGEGENGILQAMLSGSKIPHTGSNFKTSAIAMDKLLSKYIAQQAEVKTPKYYVISKQDFDNNSFPEFDACRLLVSERKTTPEIVIKPIDSGSSVGVSIISEESKWKASLSDAFQYSDKVMVEDFIDGRELTVTILDGRALPVVEIKPNKGFYDYPNKYTNGNTNYTAPADLSEIETKTVQELAIKVWKAMECSGYARIDFRYNGEEFYFLEVNTLPGMTPLSLTPMAAKGVGMSFGELLNKIIEVVPVTLT